MERRSRVTEVAPYTRFSSDRRSGASHLLTCFMFFHEKSPLNAQIRLKPLKQLFGFLIACAFWRHRIKIRSSRRQHALSRQVAQIWVRVHCILPNRFCRSRYYAYMDSWLNTSLSIDKQFMFHFEIHLTCTIFHWWPSRNKT